MSNTLYNMTLFIAKHILPTLAILLALQLSISMPINHDIGWLFHATQQWLNGHELYTSIIEINPPMIFLLMSPATWLYDISDLTAAGTIKIYFSILITFATLLHFRIIQKIISKQLFYHVYITATIVIVFIVPLGDFAQRDHLAILFFLPYMLSRFIDAIEQQNASILGLCFIGFVAGIGLSLKPYFILFPIGCECWFLVQTRNWKLLFSPQVISLVTTGLIFISFVVIFQPQYISQMIPLALATYWTYGQPLAYFNIPFLSLIFAITVIAGLRLQNKNQKQLSSLFALMTAIAMVSFILQSHYSYQLVPFKTLLFLQFILVICFYLKQFETLNKLSLVIGLVSIIWMISYTAQSLSKGNAIFVEFLQQKKLPSFSAMGKAHLEHSIQVINQNFSNKPVYVLSSNVWPSAFITLYTNSRWISGFPATWPLPAIDTAERYPEQLSIKKYNEIENIKEAVLSKIKEEITLNQPIAIIVDISEPPSYFNSDFKFVSFFESQPQLQNIFNNYELSNLDISFYKTKKYQVYIKRDISTLASLNMKQL